MVIRHFLFSKRFFFISGLKLTWENLTVILVKLKYSGLKYSKLYFSWLLILTWF